MIFAVIYKPVGIRQPQMSVCRMSFTKTQKRPKGVRTDVSSDNDAQSSCTSCLLFIMLLFMLKTVLWLQGNLGSLKNQTPRLHTAISCTLVLIHATLILNAAVYYCIAFLKSQPEIFVVHNYVCFLLLQVIERSTMQARESLLAASLSPAVVSASGMVSFTHRWL